MTVQNTRNVVVLYAKTLIQDRHKSVNKHSVSLESVSCEGPDMHGDSCVWQ